MRKTGLEPPHPGAASLTLTFRGLLLDISPCQIAVHEG